MLAGVVVLLIEATERALINQRDRIERLCGSHSGATGANPPPPVTGDQQSLVDVRDSQPYFDRLHRSAMRRVRGSIDDDVGRNLSPDDVRVRDQARRGWIAAVLPHPVRRFLFIRQGEVSVAE